MWKHVYFDFNNENRDPWDESLSVLMQTNTRPGHFVVTGLYVCEGVFVAVCKKGLIMMSRSKPFTVYSACFTITLRVAYLTYQTWNAF